MKSTFEGSGTYSPQIGTFYEATASTGKGIQSILANNCALTMKDEAYSLSLSSDLG